VPLNQSPAKKLLAKEDPKELFIEKEKGKKSYRRRCIG